MLIEDHRQDQEPIQENPGRRQNITRVLKAVAMTLPMHQRVSPETCPLPSEKAAAAVQALMKILLELKKTKLPHKLGSDVVPIRHRENDAHGPAQVLVKSACQIGLASMCRSV